LKGRNNREGGEDGLEGLDFGTEARRGVERRNRRKVSFWEGEARSEGDASSSRSVEKKGRTRGEEDEPRKPGSLDPGVMIGDWW